MCDHHYRDLGLCVDDAKTCTAAHRSANTFRAILARLTEVLREILSTFRNRNYLILMVGYFFFMITSGIYDTLNVFINTYFWELTPEEIKWFGAIALPMIIVGALASPVLQRRFDRKPVIVAALIFMTIFAQLVIDLRLLGLLPENHDDALLRSSWPMRVPSRSQLALVG